MRKSKNFVKLGHPTVESSCDKLSFSSGALRLSTNYDRYDSYISIIQLFAHRQNLDV